MANPETADTAENAKKDSPPEPFVCKEPECDKQFSSSTALARHSKNHSDECTDICPICEVGFFRHDLLTRHMKLHADKGEQPGRSQTRRIRRRCHTACDRCRDSRKRCDGHQPCAACQVAGKPCKFDTSSQRMSRVLTRERQPSSVESSGTVNGTALETVESNSLTTWSHGDAGHGGLPIPMDISPGVEQLPSECSSNIEDRQITLDNALCDLMPWPWLHENAFLTEHTNTAMDSIISADIGLPLDLYQDALRDQLATECGQYRPAEAPSTLPLANSDIDHALDSGTTGQTGGAAPNTAMIDPAIIKHQAIDDVVRSAGLEARGFSKLDRVLFWDSVSRKITQAFQLELSASTVMNRFLQLYLDHFHPLWPLVSRQNLEPRELHPYLYLVLSSIGAMYDSSSAKEYGSMMHTALCTCLCAPLELELEDDGNDLIWLAQARLLTQVAALYFNQVRAFSFAQHLGVLLITQARKMSLFSAPFYRNGRALFQRRKHVYPDAERLNLWLNIEARRRLAFGIFRGDTFTSTILNTKPLVTLEEIHLEFPTCRIVWAGERMEPRQALDIIDHDRTPSYSLLASDIYHIALDRGESLPPLEPLAHELLLFGLQGPLWRFSHDKDLFERLTGKQGNEDLCRIPYEQTELAFNRRPELMALETESLDTLSRRMADLVADRERLLFALGKWERALPMVKTFSQSEQDRSFMLSGLILYHVGYMRLLAPIEEVHQIQYHVMNGSPVDSTMVQNIVRWADSPQATVAVSRVGSVWSLLDKESRRSPNNRSKINILAFIGLHHGAALLWAFVGCRRDKTESEWLPLLGFDNSFPLPVSDDGLGESGMFQPFIDLYDRINPAGWASFVEATKVLARNRFFEAVSLDAGMDG
ncbi:fungal-specific transcription factor domain-containing protein [Ilyonectria destructans]|nr:fungal-specific transcription factor domain-containing protein [Ilyonectria destructans]